MTFVPTLYLFYHFPLFISFVIFPYFPTVLFLFFFSARDPLEGRILCSINMLCHNFTLNSFILRFLYTCIICVVSFVVATGLAYNGYSFSNLYYFCFIWRKIDSHELIIFLSRFPVDVFRIFFNFHSIARFP